MIRLEKHFFLYITSFIIYSFLIVGCNIDADKNLDAINHFGSTDNNNIELDIYNSNSYTKKATKILNDGKKRLQKQLPNLIYDQLGVYKVLLNEINEQAILGYSYSQTQYQIEVVKKKALYKLYGSEIKINQTYYEIVNELLLLNDDFYNSYQENNETINFIDYYNVSPFILSNDVQEKIDELIKDENTRLAVEKGDNLKSGAFLLLEITIAIIATPAALAALKRISKSVAVGAKISSSASKVSKLTAKILNQKTAKVFKRALSNNDKRIKMANKLDKVQFAQPGIELSKAGFHMVAGHQIGKTIDYFKSAENKIEGRIGDFSDGIITQPIGNLRKLIILNKELIK